MSCNNVLLAKNVNVPKLKFSEPKTLTNQSRTVYVNYEGDKLTIQTPLQRLPYGIGDWNETNNAGKKAEDSVKKYDLHVSFTDLESNPKMKSLLDKMRDIETRIVDEAYANRVSWLQDDYEGSKKLVEKLFVPIIKVDKDKDTKKVVGKYPPTMKLKLPYDNRNDCFSFDAQTIDGEPIDFKDVMTNLKGSKARLIIQLSGLWFAGGRYGCTWKVVRGMFEVNNKKAQPQFIPDSDDEDEAEENDEDDADLLDDAASAAETSPVQVPVPTTDPDLDEDEEEEEEEDDDSEVDEPPPPPPPVKKPTKAGAKSKK